MVQSTIFTDTTSGDIEQRAEMKRYIGDLPAVTELSEILIENDPTVWVQECAADVMQENGVNMALQRAVLADIEAVELVFNGW